MRFDFDGIKEVDYILVNKIVGICYYNGFVILGEVVLCNCEF